MSSLYKDEKGTMRKPYSVNTIMEKFDITAFLKNKSNIKHYYAITSFNMEKQYIFYRTMRFSHIVCYSTPSRIIQQQKDVF